MHAVVFETFGDPNVLAYRDDLLPANWSGLIERVRLI